MAANGLVDVGGFGGGSDRFLQAGFIHVMAAHQIGARVAGEFGGRKDVLPAPFLGGIGIFPIESVGQINAAKAPLQIIPVESGGISQLALQRGNEAIG